MQSQSGNKIISGIEPVDELLGGLDRSQLYLVHGEAAGKSLFGIKFLIEGLKHGENGALVIRYSPEDAVRRFARLGYDCLEDVYSGRLVILEYSDDIIQKIGKLRELTPVLRELEWLLGETRPERLIFDPVASVLAGAEGSLQTRAHEFAEWARSFAATVVLIANESNHEIINSFEPLVAESFRFDVREIGERATRFISFEKSLVIPDQAIEVDPSRGVFLLGSGYAEKETGRHQPAPHPPSIAELDSIREELRAARLQRLSEEAGRTIDIELSSESSVASNRTQIPPDTTHLKPEETPPDTLQTHRLTPVEEREFQAQRTRVASMPPVAPVEELELPLTEPVVPSAPAEPRTDGQFDELSHLLDDLTGSASPLDLDLPELSSPQVEANKSNADQAASAREVAKRMAVGSREDQPLGSHSAVETPTAGSETRPERSRHGRASDLRIDSVMAARAVELLLQPPDAAVGSPFPASPKTRRRRTDREAVKPEPLSEGDPIAKDFNILVIEDDSETCELVTQTLSDYTLEIVHDGVSGLARLISFKPDLVVLDFDLPVIDGFKVLALIRSALNVPIIIVSGSRMRAIDRVMASELGADYYLTKPFSAKELKHKARQLIARYRGLSSWIVAPSSGSSTAPPARSAEKAPAAASQQQMFTPYSEFAAEVEKRVKTAMADGAPFSIVGCRLSAMTADGGRLALRLFEIVRELARDADLTSTNPRNDLVILLADAGAPGARAFLGRVRARVMEELNQEPTLWMRSFPDLEESAEAALGSERPAAGNVLNRRSGDTATSTNDQTSLVSPQPGDPPASKSDPLDSYIDFLEKL